jgi:hypothetical protein
MTPAMRGIISDAKGEDNFSGQIHSSSNKQLLLVGPENSKRSWPQ